MLSVLLFAALQAQAGELQMVHSGRLVGGDGLAIGGTHDLTVTLYTEAQTAVWQDEFESESFPNGQFSVVLGTDDIGRTLESALVAAEPAVWVGIQIDDDDELQPWSPLTAVPLAARTMGVPVAAGIVGQTCPGPGAVSLDTTLGNLAVCVDGVWSAVAAPCASTEIQDGGCRLAVSCKELHDNDDSLDSGTYTIDPDGSGGFSVQCDMDTAGGGWTRLVKSAPASTHPGWNSIGGYQTIESASHISPAWHRLSAYTEIMTTEGATVRGGNITSCGTAQTMANRVGGSSTTCSTSAVSGLSQQATYYFNASTSHQGCSGLNANVAYRFNTWDGGVSGSWVGVGLSGYKTNNSTNCGTSCVKYSNSCLSSTYSGNTGTQNSLWVR